MSDQSAGLCTFILFLKRNNDVENMLSTLDVVKLTQVAHFLIVI